MRAALLLLVPALAAAQGVEFKGVPIGAPKAELVARFPAVQCAPPGRLFWTLGEEHCTIQNYQDANLATYASVPGWDYSFPIVAGKVEGFTLSIKPDTYDSVKRTLSEAYGPGKETVRTVQLRTGAKFDSRKWSATRAGTTIELYEHGISADAGTVGATSEALTRWRATRAAETAKKGASNI